MLRVLFLGVLVTNFFSAFGQQIILKSELSHSGGGVLLPNNPEKEPEAVSKPFEPKQFKSLNESVINREHEVVMVGKIAPKGVNIYEIALFGGFQKSFQQMEEDKAFLEDCDRNFESREKASFFFSDMGWQYLSEGSKEMATYRYNLAYLLNPKNVDVFWGLGVIEYQKDEYEEAIRLMSLGLEASTSPNVTLLVDLATVHINCFTENKHNSDLQKAYQLLNQAINLKPDNANAYIQLALANLVNGKIDEAWMSFHKGFEKNPSVADKQLLSDLLKIKADPKGIFK